MAEAVQSGWYRRVNGGSRDIEPTQVNGEIPSDAVWVEKGEWIPQTAPTGPMTHEHKAKLESVGVDTAAFGEDSFNQSVACSRQPVSRVLKIPAIKDRIQGMIDSPTLAYNQQLNHCCRNPEEHGDIVACYSNPEEQAKGMPDIYIFICNDCGRSHPRLCCGVGDPRPVWEVR